MVDRAKKAFVPPFVNHVFADPAGSFTTGAAMVAQVSRALRTKYGTDLKGKRIVIFGGAGVVAYVAAVIARWKARSLSSSGMTARSGSPRSPSR